MAKANGNDTIVIDTPAVTPTVKDIMTMSDDEIMEFQKQRRIEKQKLAAEKGQQARKELEAYCQKKYGLSLQQIYTASGKTQELKTYRNPNDPDAKAYTYSGRGKVPAWLKGVNGKPNPQYEVKTN